jgi:hypothetical protein
MSILGFAEADGPSVNSLGGVKHHGKSVRQIGLDWLRRVVRTEEAGSAAVAAGFRTQAVLQWVVVDIADLRHAPKRTE